MVLSRVDQAELLAALYQISDANSFSPFLDRLRRRTRAEEAILLERRERGDWRSHGAQPSTAKVLPPLPLPVAKLAALRPGRLYDFDELDLAGVGKLIRIASAKDDAWLGIRSDGDRPFDAADGALLVALSSHVSIALDNQARFDELRVETAASRAALDRAGVGWTLLDLRGEPMAGAPPPVPTRSRVALSDAIAAGSPSAVAERVIAVPFAEGEKPAVLTLFRTAARAADRAAAIEATFGLTRAEARMAAALAAGLSIVEAAARLKITEQTARYYTKRLYAATGARGQADLVRLIWNSVAALA